MAVIDNGSIEYKSEVLRKSIHLCSLSIPIIYYFVTRELALQVLVPMALISLLLDLGRYFYKPFSKFFYMIFGFMLRKHEMDELKRNLNGATYVLISAALTIAIFPKVFAITAFAVLIIGDISAALIGRKFGKHKFFFKSLEGTLAFLVTGSIVVLFSPKVEGLMLEYLIGFIAIAIGALAENLSYGWADDNLTIPLSIGGAMWLLYYLLLPNLSLTLPNVPN